MSNRITKNEERLDKASLSVKNLENALNDFKKNKKSIEQLNNYLELLSVPLPNILISIN